MNGKSNFRTEGFAPEKALDTTEPPPRKLNVSDDTPRNCFTASAHDELKEAVKPVQDWIKKYGHPHLYVSVNADMAEVWEGLLTTSEEKA